MSRYVGAIDQGTTSSRFIVFDREGSVIALAQAEHAQIYPAPGHVEHDATEIWTKTQGVMREALEKGGLVFSGMSPDGTLPEIVERPDHPWFVGVQFHPELKSKPFDPHPLFASFIEAAVRQSRLV